MSCYGDSFTFYFMLCMGRGVATGISHGQVAYWVCEGLKILKAIKAQQKGCRKNGVFWDITPCGSCKKRRFGGT
jgi:hypothetical protein